MTPLPECPAAAPSLLADLIHFAVFRYGRNTNFHRLRIVEQVGSNRLDVSVNLLRRALVESGKPQLSPLTDMDLVDISRLQASHLACLFALVVHRTRIVRARDL